MNCKRLAATDFQSNNARPEAPPFTDGAAAHANRPRPHQMRMASLRTRAAVQRAQLESCPEGNHSDLPRMRYPRPTPYRIGQGAHRKSEQNCPATSRESCSFPRVTLLQFSLQTATRSHNSEGRVVIAPDAGRENTAGGCLQQPTTLPSPYPRVCLAQV